MTPDEKAEVCNALNEREEWLEAMERRLVQAQEERVMWRSLLYRAAELLRMAEPALNLNMLETHITPRDTWYDDRHQWYVDAGMEK